MAESRKPVISVHDLAKNYGELKVLRKIDMDIYKGEVVSVIGPSGSGKSTFQMSELSRGADIRRDRYRRSFPKGHRRGQAQQKAQRKGCKGHKKERWNGVPAVQPLAAQNSA